MGIPQLMPLELCIRTALANIHYGKENRSTILTMNIVRFWIMHILDYPHAMPVLIVCAMDRPNDFKLRIRLIKQAHSCKLNVDSKYYALCKYMSVAAKPGTLLGVGP